MSSPPAAKSIAGGKDKPEFPVHVSCDREDKQGRNGINQDDKNLVHIDLNKVNLQQMV